MSEEIAEVYDVIIVGGGFTGLTAARDLARRGVKLRLLDAFPDHLGGRGYSYDPGVTPGSKLKFDHGAEYVGETQNEIMQLVRDHLGPDALVNGAHLRSPYPHQVILIGGTRHVFKVEDSLFGIKGVPPQVGIGAAIAFIGLLAEMMLVEIQIDTLEPWKGDDDLLELDKISISQWLDGKKWVSQPVRDLLTLSVEALLSVEPSEISIYFLLWYTACNNGFLTAINDDTAGPQQYWLKEGVGTLAERYADVVRDRIQQGVFVDKIDLSGENVAVTTRGGATLHAKKVLVAMSPHTAGRIEYVPEPPAGRRALMRLPMGRTLKCQVFYKSSWWHDVEGIDFNGYGGGCNHSIIWTMDNSPPPESGDDTHVLMTFTVGAQLDALGSNLSQDAIEAWVTGGIRDFFGDDRALSTSSEFIKLVHYAWSAADPYVGGGPNIVYPPGALTGEVGRHMNEHWDDRVFFASAENAKNLHPTSSSTHWNVLHDDNMPKYSDDGLLLADPPPPYRTNYSDVRQSVGYLDGAIVSGRYVASEIATSLGLEDETRSRRSTLSAPARRGPVSRPSAAAALGVFESIRAEVDAATHDDIKGWKENPAGPKGYASWVHRSLVKALGAVDGEPVKKLAMVRDFAETVAPRLQGDEASPDSAPLSAEELPVFERIRVLVADTDAAIRKKLGLD